MRRDVLDRTPAQVHAQLGAGLRTSQLRDGPTYRRNAERSVGRSGRGLAQVRHALEELEAAFAPDKRD